MFNQSIFRFALSANGKWPSDDQLWLLLFSLSLSPNWALFPILHRPLIPFYYAYFDRSAESEVDFLPLPSRFIFFYRRLDDIFPWLKNARPRNRDSSHPNSQKWCIQTGRVVTKERRNAQVSLPWTFRSGNQTFRTRNSPLQNQITPNDFDYKLTDLCSENGESERRKATEMSSIGPPTFASNE